MGYQNRNEIAEKYKWNLADIFPSDAAWEECLVGLEKEVPQFTRFKGKLNNADIVLESNKILDDFTIRLEKVYGYAFMKYCEDRKSTADQTRFGKAQQMLTRLNEVLSYYEPELSAQSDAFLQGLLNDPRFADYTERLRGIIRSKKHILSESEEKLLAGASDPMRFFQDIFNRLDSGELDYGTIKVDGKKVKLGHGEYQVMLQNPNQKVRKAAFETYYKAYMSHINTISGIYEGSVRADWFRAKTRKYGSSLEAALFGEDVDKKVYDNLIKSVNATLKPMHEYVALRKKILGVKKLNMYDLAVPMFENANMAMEYEQAYDLVVEGLKPLGADYQKMLRHAREHRWLDVHETPTKYAGAYSNSVPSVHPYVLLNYQKTTHDIFTIAHELGHAMHSYTSEKTQPYAKADYKIFVAEVASTCNEVLLLNYLLAKEKDVNVKKYLLSYFLDMLRTTMYRQTMFAQFEQITHQKCEKGEPLSFELMCNEYYKLNKKYYGRSVKHNEQIKYEWARIPHFYRAFYVYKYATGITSAVCLAQKILKEGAPAVERYKKFLGLGGSTDPVSELKVAGVDLTTKEPFEIVAAAFNDTLAQLKQLCGIE